MRTLRSTFACALLLAGLMGSQGLHAQSPSGQAGLTTSPAAAQTLDAILEALSTWDGGIESDAVWTLRDYVDARRDDAAGRAECEAGLLRFLRSGATPAAKIAAGRLLRQVAGDTAVPALQAMLRDEELADLAIYSLQQMPGAAADQALIESVARVRGPVRVAVVAALGERRSTAAVPAIVPLLEQPETARAAAIALGRIGGAEAVTALEAARDGAEATVASAIASALLASAEQYLEAKDVAAAARIYGPLVADAALPASIRRAAAIGRLAASGSAARLVEHLGSSDPLLQAAAVALLAALVPPDGIGPVLALFPGLPESVQVQVLAALPQYPAVRVRPTVLGAAGSTAPDVRLAALAALAAVGNESDVMRLARAAAETRGQEQTATRAALVGLRGAAVDQAILTALAGPAAEPVQAELLLAASDRRLFAARPLVMDSLASPSDRLRLQALRSLRTIGTPSDASKVLDLLLSTGDDREQSEAERTVVALAMKVADPDTRSRLVRNRLAEEEETGSRVRLIALLPMIGDNAALPVLRVALDDSDPAVHDAAVRALVAWPASVARDDVMQLARDSRDETHRLLAIAGLVRLITREPSRNPVAAVADLRAAASFAWRPEEQRLVLGALPRFASQEALELATGFLKVPEVREEAEAAIERIETRLAGRQGGG